MPRRYFAEVIQSGDFSVADEYRKLYNLFYTNINYTSLYHECKINLLNCPFRGTCLSIDEFNIKYGFHFKKDFYNGNETLDDLVNFIEYTYNFVVLLSEKANGYGNQVILYKEQIAIIESSIGYMHQFDETSQTYIFVSISEAATAVSEIIDPELSSKVIFYNHHSMKGDLARKRDTLLKLADKLESQRSVLKGINHQLETDVFTLFNSINIRHNNSDPDGAYYKPYVASWDDDTQEEWYDETYQLILLCFLEIDNIERKKKIKELKDNF